MKKYFILLFIFIIVSPIFSAFIPTYDSFDAGYFKTPARLVEIEDSTPFGFELEMGSDIDGLTFLADPAKGLQSSANHLGKFLSRQGNAFWDKNYGNISSIFSSIDANFPSSKPADEFDYDQLRDYFSDDFLHGLTDEQRAYAVARTLDALKDAGVYPADSTGVVGGDTYLALQLYGGKIKNGFGWDWNVNFNYDGSKSLVDRFGGRMSVDARMNIGYAFHMISERFSVGVVAQPQLRFQMDIPNQGYLLARLEDEPLSIFGENLNFGTAIAFNFGAMYRHNENLAFELDVRNAPYFQSFFYISTDDIANEDVKFRRDKNIYFVPPDVALTAFWDWNKYHIEVELSDIVNQLIWENEYPELSFNYYSVPKIRFGYDIIDEMTIGAKLQYNTFAVDFGWKGLTAEISTKLDIFAIGMKVGYRF